MHMRLLRPLVLAAAGLSLCSCATQDMIAKAEGRPGPLDPPNQPPTKPNAAYYALVPLVLPFDLVAWPIQLIYLKDRQQYGPATPPPPGSYQQYPPPSSGYQSYRSYEGQPYRPGGTY